MIRATKFIDHQKDWRFLPRAICRFLAPWKASGLKKGDGIKVDHPYMLQDRVDVSDSSIEKFGRLDFGGETAGKGASLDKLDRMCVVDNRIPYTHNDEVITSDLSLEDGNGGKILGEYILRQKFLMRTNRKWDKVKIELPNGVSKGALIFRMSSSSKDGLRGNLLWTDRARSENATMGSEYELTEQNISLSSLDNAYSESDGNFYILLESYFVCIGITGLRQADYKIKFRLEGKEEYDEDYEYINTSSFNSFGLKNMYVKKVEPRPMQLLWEVMAEEGPGLAMTKILTPTSLLVSPAQGGVNLFWEWPNGSLTGDQLSRCQFQLQYKKKKTNKWTEVSNFDQKKKHHFISDFSTGVYDVRVRPFLTEKKGGYGDWINNSFNISNNINLTGSVSFNFEYSNPFPGSYYESFGNVLGLPSIYQVPILLRSEFVPLNTGPKNSTFLASYYLFTNESSSCNVDLEYILSENTYSRDTKIYSGKNKPDYIRLMSGTSSNPVSGGSTLKSDTVREFVSYRKFGRKFL